MNQNFKGNPIILLLFGLLMALPSLAQQDVFFPAKEQMPVGAYYYPEHWPRDQWERDIKKIADLGFEFTHFAEFAWSRLEPTEGNYDFEWLDYCVDLAHKYGLKVIMCTPTPCPPAWLTHKHPEIQIMSKEGRRIQHGNRRTGSNSSDIFREYSLKIVKKMAERYGNDKRIWGWQIDNEPHLQGNYDYSPEALSKFRVWLKNKYQTIDKLNAAWGAAFWSLEYNSFEHIKFVNAENTLGNGNPHQKLDFQLFTADEITDFLRIQAEEITKHADPKQWITTNYAYLSFLPEVNPFLGKQDFDFASYTMYLLSTYLHTDDGPLAYRLGSGLEMSYTNEFNRSVNGYTGIMELQPGQINWGAYNAQPLPGAVRMWLWHNYSLDAKFICTYRFRQPAFGGEQFHKGITETDGVTLSPGGTEYVKFIEEIGTLGKNFKPTANVPEEIHKRRVGFLWKHANLLDLENVKHNNRWSTFEHYYHYYSALKSCGAQVTFLTENDELNPKTHPMLVAPAYELVTPELIEKLADYVKKGGHLIMSARSGYKNPNGHLWHGLYGHMISELTGATVAYNDQLPPNTNANLAFDNKNYEWDLWAEILKPHSGTETWAQYADNYYKGETGITYRKFGDGSVTYVGVASSNGKLENSVVRKVYQKRKIDVLNLPPYVFVNWRAGTYVMVNYTSNPVPAPLNGGKLIIGEEVVKPGGVAVWK